MRQGGSIWDDEGEKEQNMEFMACHAFFENDVKFLHYTNILQIMRNMQNIVNYVNIVKIRKKMEIQ